MKLRLTKQSIRMLSDTLEKKIKVFHELDSYPITSEDIAYWIAEWTRDQMEREAIEMFASLVSK